MILILDKKFWKKLEYCVMIWKPIAETLDKSQPDVANTGQFYWNYKDLTAKFGQRARNKSLPDWDRALAMKMIQCLREAWNKFLTSKIFQACAIIDPRFTTRIDEMNERDKNDALLLLKQQSIALSNEFNINWRKFLKKKENSEQKDNNTDTNGKEDGFATFQFDFDVDKTLFDFDFSFISKEKENDNNNGDSINNDNDNNSDCNVISGNANIDDNKNNKSKKRKRKEMSDSDDENENVQDNIFDAIIKPILEELWNRDGPFATKKWKSLGDHSSLKKVLHLFRSLRKRKKNTKYEVFCIVALDIITSCDSNAGTERFFNPIRTTHSWARSRLGSQILDAMLYIYIQERCLRRLGVIS